MINQNDSLSIIVSSCDSFSFCWEPFLYSLSSFWPDCAYEVYFISNGKSLEISNPHIHFVNVGTDKQWGTNLKMALTKITSSWILYFQEDYFLEKKVKTKEIECHLDYCIKQSIDYLRLTEPFFKGNVDSYGYIKLSTGKKYAICLQTAIWNRKTLFEIIQDGWTGWDFEREVSSLLKKNGIELNAWVIDGKNWNEIGIKYVQGTAIRKGRWTISGVNFLSTFHFSNLINLRPVEGHVLSFFQDNVLLPKVVSRIGAKIMNIFKLNF